MTSVAVLLALLALSLHQGEAIDCYVCSSTKDPSCRDPFQTTHQSYKLTHCSPDSMRNQADLFSGIFSSYGYSNSQPEEFVCVKAVTREHDREVVLRGCSIPRADTFDVCSQLKSNRPSFCETCDRDNCNGALQLGPASLLSLLSTAAVMVAHSRP